MKKELGITVSVGVSFNKIFAKLGSDYKKPDAITTMYEDEFQRKAWCLPVSDLLYVGNATNKKFRKRSKCVKEKNKTKREIDALYRHETHLRLYE